MLLKQAREKGEHDNTFTESVLEKLFCNIESILDLHRKLVEELNAALKGGVAYGSLIAGVYLKFVSDLVRPKVLEARCVVMAVRKTLPVE